MVTYRNGFAAKEFADGCLLEMSVPGKHLTDKDMDLEHARKHAAGEANEMHRRTSGKSTRIDSIEGLFAALGARD